MTDGKTGAAPVRPTAHDRDEARRNVDAPSLAPTLDSRQLFGGANEIRIDHDGTVYRLKRTALGKLILTK